MQDPVASGQRFAIFAVTAADHSDYRDIAAQTVAHHALIAGGHACIGQFQITQGIVLVNIDTRVVQHQIGLIKRQQVIERFIDHLQIFGIPHAHGQANVPVALRLACRKILFAVQGNGNCIRRMFKNPRRAIALVYIAIEDQYPVYPAAFQ